MATAKKPATVEPWQTLDWSNNGPHGAATKLPTPRPCMICGKPAWLLSPHKGQPLHKAPCAETLILVQLLGSVLQALGTAETRGGPLASHTRTAVDDPHPAPADHITNPKQCALDGQPLLLIRPGRDVCARHT